MKNKIKYNPDIFIKAAEDFFDSRWQTQYSCLVLEWSGEEMTGSVPKNEIELYERIFEIGSYGSLNSTFNCNGFDLKGTRFNEFELRETRLLCLCLAAEIARLANNKKGGQF